MITEKTKPQPVDFQIRSIQLLEVFLAEPDDFTKSLSDFSFDIRMELKINDEQRFFMIITDIKVRMKDHQKMLGEVKTQCVYHIDQFEKVTAKGHDCKIKIPKHLTDTLNSISLSTTRGIMFSAFRGTHLHHAILPAIDPTNLLEGNS